MSTITGTYSSGVTIGSGTYTSPLTIASGATVSIGSTAGTAVYSASLATVVEYGYVSATGTEGAGIGLKAGGYVTVGTAGVVDGYEFGIVAFTGPGTVTNTGTIEASATANTRLAVYLADGGVVSNSGTGLIQGSQDGVSINNAAAGTVTNSSTIEGLSKFGVYLGGGGSVDNEATALIDGRDFGIFTTIFNDPITVTNAGTIAATIDPSYLFGIAIHLGAGGTIVDSGTIDGPGGAVYFGGNGSNLLELETGYSISGSITGSDTAGATNTLELSGSLGAVTATYNSLGLTDFQTLEFGGNNGNDETFVFTETSGTIPLTIEGMTVAYKDILDLRDLGAPVTYRLHGDLLTVVGANGTVDFNLGAVHASNFTLVADGFGGTEIEPACFARGTMILTEAGERPVEALKIGDRVVTRSGRPRPIKWIGRRSYKGALLLRNGDLWPIRVAAGALGPGTPRRDLCLSAKHALCLDGLLVPVECLVNRRSIRRCDCPEEIEYFHIELDSHDVIFAEGAAAETFVDCDTRGIFHNAHEFALLYPGEEPPRWAFCAPRVEAGRELDAVRRRLLARAEALRPAA